ncbi:MAG TPA: hypothetical protein VK894_14940 [Jiangellales bacterium]|nr:hypothetical protein [Jiangellales bacterium]
MGLAKKALALAAAKKGFQLFQRHRAGRAGTATATGRPAAGARRTRPAR